MTYKTKAPPESDQRIKNLCEKGLSGGEIAKEIWMPPTTVDRIIKGLGFTVNKRQKPPAPVPQKPMPKVKKKKELVDYSNAKITIIALPAPPSHIVCNATMRESYVPNELRYRGSRA